MASLNLSLASQGISGGGGSGGSDGDNDGLDSSPRKRRSYGKQVGSQESEDRDKDEEEEVQEQEQEQEEDAENDEEDEDRVVGGGDIGGGGVWSVEYRAECEVWCVKRYV